MPHSRLKFVIRWGLVSGLIAGFLIGLSVLYRSWKWRDAQMVELIRELNQSPVGAGLLRRAQAKWSFDTLEDVAYILNWGRVSKTDAVITRQYDPVRRVEKKMREVRVTLKSDQSQVAKLLDLAHELTHATASPSWDPYDPNLNPGAYIRTAIEGEGGEAQALITECRVALELKLESSEAATRCLRYLEADEKTLSRTKIIKEFYRVGAWKNVLIRKLNGAQSIPELSDGAPQLYSSTGKSPYPVALLDEYEALTEAACVNTQRREIASTHLRSQKSLFLEKRCSKGYSAISWPNPPKKP